jgi:hypothetical protein
LVEREYLDHHRPVDWLSATVDGCTGNSVKAGSGTNTDKDLLRMPADDLGSVGVEQCADQALPCRVVDVVEVVRACVSQHDGRSFKSSNSV